MVIGTWEASRPCQSSQGTQFPQGKQLHKGLQGQPKENWLKIQRHSFFWCVDNLMIWLTVDPHGMAKKGEAGPRHLCDNCSDGCKVLHVVVMEACSAEVDIVVH